jgi:hypothetical protein
LQIAFLCPTAKLRALVRLSLENGSAFNSRFFADKLVSITAGRPVDVLLLARAHVAMGDHRQVGGPLVVAV